MPELNWLAVIVAAIAVFIVSSVYYIVFAPRTIELRGASAEGAQAAMPPWKIAVELGRNLVLATAVAGLVAVIGPADVAAGVLLAAVLWVAFPVVLLLGSVIWENVAPGLAAIHAGDWLLKLGIMSVIVMLWA